MKPFPSDHSRFALLAAVLGLGGCMSGCDTDHEARAAVREAANRFQRLAAGDEQAYPEHAAETYEEIIGLVSGYAGDDSGLAESAAVTLAQARLGEAALASQRAALAETESLHRIRVMRAVLSEWMTLSAMGRAASAFDPEENLGELETIIADRRADAERYNAQKAEIDADIAALELQISELREQAGEERRHAGELELRMSGVSAQEAAELAVEAREFYLRADQLGLEAVRLEGVVGQLRPTAAEIGLNVAKAVAQIEGLERSQEELRERERVAESDAAALRKAADEAQNRLIRLASELVEFRDGEVASESEAIAALLGQAERAVRDAGGVLKASAAATRSAIEGTRASMLTRRATGHDEAAAIYEALADAGIPGDHARNAEAERAASAEAKAAAQEAYRAAASALRQIRTTGESRDRIERAASRLDALGGVEPEPEFEEDASETGDGSAVPQEASEVDEVSTEGAEPGAEPPADTPEDDG